MTFLTKIGKVLAGVGVIAAEVLNIPFVGALLQGKPKAGAVVDTVLGDLNNIAGILAIVQAGYADAAPGTASSQKLALAAPSIRAVLLAWAGSNLPGHNKVKDAAKVAEGARQLTSGFALFLEGLGD